MKALSFFFLSLLAAFSFAASAQTIEVYKDGRVIDSFSAAQVDSVVYTPAAAQPRYYYYAGWDCPTSVEGAEETSLVNLINKTYPTSNSDSTPHVAGGEFESIDPSKLDHNKNYYPNTLMGPSKTNWYLVLPSTLNAYDYYSNGLWTDNDLGMKKVENQKLDGYTIWLSVEPSKYIENIKIY